MNQKIIFLSSIIILFSLSYFVQIKSHKIIYLISPPRSSSVAFLRMMQARNDFIIMHEPTILAHHYFSRTKEFESGIITEWYNEDAPKTFEEVKKQILENAAIGPVFVKEMGFAAKDFLFENKDFASDPNIIFVFLLRNPHHSIISFYKKIENLFDEISAYKFTDLIGLKACSQIYKFLKSIGKNPVIVTAEDLYLQPNKTIEQFCRSVAIPFIESALVWDNLGEGFSGKKEWHEIKKQEITHHWHNDAIQSTGFAQPRHSYDVDQDGNPTFVEIKNLEHRALCIAAYKENLVYYQQLLASK